MLIITQHIQIPDSELELSYARSSGPGGQNVNKVNSKAVLRWNALESQAFPPDIHLKLIQRLGARMTEAGELVLMSDRFRDQGRNREDCLEKLKQILLASLSEPKKRKKTKPTRASRERKKESKKKDSRKKSLRRRPIPFD